MVRNNNNPVFSFTPEIQKITCASAIKEYGNNYIAFSGVGKYIIIYKIISLNNQVQYKEELVFKIYAKFIDSDLPLHERIPHFCYLSTWDKFTFAACNDKDNKIKNFNFFEINDKKEDEKVKKLILK